MSSRKECRECSALFVPTRHWQVFCGNKCKLRFNRKNKDHCAYCGCGLNGKNRHRDHLYAVSMRGTKRYFEGQEYLYTCAQCNIALGAYPECDFESRLLFLYQYYSEKIPSSFVDWTDKEIGELGQSLRQYISKFVSQYRELALKVEYLQAVFFMETKRLPK
jgi:hypothetical protein